MTGHSVGVNELGQTKDPATMESLSGDTDRPNLAHFLSTVGHPLVHHVAHLQSQLSGKVVVQVGGAGCGDVVTLQYGKWPPLVHENVFSCSSEIVG